MQLERVAQQIEQIQRLSSSDEQGDNKIKEMQESVKTNQKKLLQVQP